MEVSGTLFPLRRRSARRGPAGTWCQPPHLVWLCDVWVEETHRGRGLGHWLVETVVGHPEVQGLRRFLLATRDAHRLYGAFGVDALGRPDAFMEIHHPDIYLRKAPPPDDDPGLDEGAPPSAPG